MNSKYPKFTKLFLLGPNFQEKCKLREELKKNSLIEYNYYKKLFSARKENTNTNIDTWKNKEIEKNLREEIQKREYKNLMLAKYIDKGDMIVKNYYKNNFDDIFSNIVHLIYKYYKDPRVTPHVLFFKTLNEKNRLYFLKNINWARQKIGLKNIVESFYKFIKYGKLSDIKMYFDLLFPELDNINETLLKNALRRIILFNKIEILKYFIDRISSFALYDFCVSESLVCSRYYFIKFLFPYINIDNIKINNRSIFNESILNISSEKIPNYLLSKKVVNPLDVDDENHNSFFYAALQNKPSLFLKMMKYCNYDKDINDYDEKSTEKIRPVFHILAHYNITKNPKYEDIIDKMISHKILDINSDSYHDCSLLHQVIAYNNLDLISLLINTYNADILHESNGNKPALHYAIQINANQQTIDLLKKKIKEIDKLRLNDDEIPMPYILRQNSQGITPLIYDISLLNTEDSNVNINDNINANESIIHYLIKNSANRNNYKKLLEIFQNNIDSIDFNNKSRDGNTILHYMAKMNRKLKKLGLLLLQENKKSELFEKIKLYEINNEKESPMDIALHRGNLPMVELLFLMGYDKQRKNLRNEMTFIHKILESANYRRSRFSPQIDANTRYLIYIFFHNIEDKNILKMKDRELRTPMIVFEDNIRNNNLRNNKNLKYYKGLISGKILSYSKSNFWMYRLKRGSFSIQKLNNNNNNYNFIERKLDFLIGQNLLKKITIYIILLTCFMVPIFSICKYNELGFRATVQTLNVFTQVFTLFMNILKVFF